MGVIAAKELTPSFNKIRPWRVDVEHGPDVPMQDRAMYPMRALEDPFIAMPVRDWCKANCSDDFELVGSYMLFNSEEDALLFFMAFKSGRQY